jgi:cobalt-zinc-cadmium efflux system protein
MVIVLLSFEKHLTFSFSDSVMTVVIGCSCGVLYSCLIVTVIKYRFMSTVPIHEHSHPRSGKRNLGIALSITIIFFIIELVGGIITNSLALTADAWHMLNDASALAFALVAAWLAERPIDVKKTYGYYRTEILAAFLNGIFLWVVVILIFYEAIQRFQHPVLVESLEMLIIAIAGLIANGLSAIALSKSRSDSLNIKGAFLHVLLDTLGSVAAISAGVIMIFTQWYPADPLFSMLLGVLIFYSSYRLIRESVNVLLEGVPYGIDVNAVERKIIELKGVKGVHDLHVWCITPNKICAMSCHIVIEEGVDRKKLLSDLIAMLKDEFGIDHTTIQLEEEGYPKAESEHS